MQFKIKDARMKINMSQRELARQVGVSPAAMNAYEQGKSDPKSDNLTKIAEICGVTVDYLLGVEDEREKAPISAKAKTEALTVDQMHDLLVNAGFIAPGQDLTDADAKFLACVILAVNQWFSNR